MHAPPDDVHGRVAGDAADGQARPDLGHPRPPQVLREELERLVDLLGQLSGGEQFDEKILGLIFHLKISLKFPLLMCPNYRVIPDVWSDSKVGLTCNQGVPWARVQLLYLYILPEQA